MKAILYLSLFFVLASISFSQESKLNNLRKIEVNASAEIEFPADYAILILNLDTWEEKLEETKTEHDKKLKKIYKKLEKYQIEKQNIKTISYGLTPIYDKTNWLGSYKDPGKDKDEIEAYYIQQGIEVKIENLKEINNLLSELMETGLDDLSNISFELDNIEEKKIQLIKKATEVAKRKAQASAEVLGMKVKKAIYIGDTRYSISRQKQIRVDALDVGDQFTGGFGHQQVNYRSSRRNYERNNKSNQVFRADIKVHVKMYLVFEIE